MPLEDRCSLRLCARSAAQLVDAWTPSLRIKQLDCVKPGLADRFTGATTLKIPAPYDTPDKPAPARAKQLRGVTLLLQGSPWRLVTTLEIGVLDKHTAALFSTACPSLQRLTLKGLDSKAGAAVKLLLLHARTALPLQSLDVGWGVSVDDALLAAVAACTSLTSLSTSLSGNVSAAGMASLLSMGALRLLDISEVWPRNGSVRRLGVLDFRPLSDLQRLRLIVCNEYDYSSDAAVRTAVDAAHQTMQLPSCLTSLELFCLPGQPQRLPLLTELRVHGTVADQDLANLAAGCSSLARLDVRVLELTRACHAAPLRSVTSLCVERVDTEEGRCAAAAGVQLAVVLPALRHLELAVECEILDQAVFFKGAAALQHLDITSSLDEGQGLRLTGDRVWQELAQLPALRTLRAELLPAHVAGVARLQQLQDVEWYLRVQEVDPGLAATLAAAKAPVGLQRASFGFEIGYMDEEDEYGDNHIDDALHILLSDMADAAVMWCVRAPSLQHVAWSHVDNFWCIYGVALTHVRLGALAASTSIRSVMVDEHEPAELFEEMAGVLRQTKGWDIRVKG